MSVRNMELTRVDLPSPDSPTTIRLNSNPANNTVIMLALFLEFPTLFCHFTFHEQIIINIETMDNLGNGNDAGKIY